MREGRGQVAPGRRAQAQTGISRSQDNEILGQGPWGSWELRMLKLLAEETSPAKLSPSSPCSQGTAHGAFNRSASCPRCRGRFRGPPLSFPAFGFQHLVQGATEKPNAGAQPPLTPVSAKMAVFPVQTSMCPCATQTKPRARRAAEREKRAEAKITRGMSPGKARRPLSKAKVLGVGVGGLWLDWMHVF